jgi:hypothetical protein
MKYTDGALLIIALTIAWSVYRANRNSDEFNLIDLLMENGRVSRIACAFLTTLVVTSWIMVTLTATGKMTEGYMVAYGAMWVTPIVAKLFSTAPAADPVKPKEPL